MRAGAGKGATQLRGNAGVAIELQGRTIPASATGWHLTKREPYGVVGAISAYSHPTLFACQRIGPPLVAGNTVVLKPSEQAPISAVAPSPASATEDPKRPVPLSSAPVSFDPCWVQVEPDRVNTHAAPTLSLSKGPPASATFPSLDSATLEPNCPAPARSPSGCPHSAAASSCRTSGARP